MRMQAIARKAEHPARHPRAAVVLGTAERRANGTAAAGWAARHPCSQARPTHFGSPPHWVASASLSPHSGATSHSSTAAYIALCFTGGQCTARSVTATARCSRPLFCQLWTQRTSAGTSASRPPHIMEACMRCCPLGNAVNRRSDGASTSAPAPPLLLHRVRRGALLRFQVSSARPGLSSAAVVSKPWRADASLGTNFA